MSHRTRSGKRVWRYRTLPSRFSSGGTVHLMYRSSDGELVQACGRTSYSDRIDDLTDPTPVNCQACLRSGWTPRTWLPGDAP